MMSCSPKRRSIAILIGLTLLIPAYVLSLPHVVTHARPLQVGDTLVFSKDPNVGEWITVTAKQLPSLEAITSGLILYSENQTEIKLAGRAKLALLDERDGMQTATLNIDGYRFVGKDKPVVGLVTVAALPEEGEWGFYICDRRTDLQRLLNRMISSPF